MSRSNIEILLSEWGVWKRGENRNPLGYPDQAAFQRMRVDGQRRSDPDALLVDDDLRRLDAFIGRLFPEVRAALTAHYVWPGVVKAKLDRVRMSRTVYYAHLNYAHNQLSHWMGDGYAVPGNYFVRTPCDTVRTESQ
ncbi:hypothetical protein ABRZ03_02420 [Castellaniella ginsengisoli]|uniref:Uncharacterized protein n=1 Tax=Castellaniella ginsengisoli TaxID=546114 RepID=A0AB39FJ53_9BURK|nr:hypothetical protein [Acidobacteriaceae bacterium]